MSFLSSYISSIQREFDTQQSTEHSFRPALKTLLESLEPKILALNESQRIVGVGMPDFTIKNSRDTTINIGRIEAKDLWVDLDEKKNSDQLGRYLAAFDNFIYTNNLTFQFYRQGKKVTTISLGTATKQSVTRTGSESDFSHLEQHLRDFLSFQGQTITSPDKLARAMAQKAQLLKYAIQQIFSQEERSQELEGQYQTFKDQLVHDLTHDQFADMYAQTIVYGLFAARLYDPTLPTFSRAEAATLVPKTNPLIRRLFKEILNSDMLDEALAYVIDDLVNIFLHCNVAEILQNYGRKTNMQDPIIHFYETFLGEYDSSMRKKRGVYYTPQSVVQFIVRGVDHLIQKEFGLTMGLADTSKVEASFLDQGKKIKKSVHRVQVLDPATGTGTFLHETIKYIRETYFAGQEGMRAGYIGKDLLPRIWGFEILMASYTMAHLKLGMMLNTVGPHPDPLLAARRSSSLGEGAENQRVNIYLTNSLEEPHDNIGNLFSMQLARESEQASSVKKEQPIMIVMGNPPYAGESSNKGERIMRLMDDYKKEPGGTQKLQEQNSKWINDDYVKFIRYAEHFIAKNSEGIVAYICPHGFLDNPTFRGMRWHLLTTFDLIYTVDLHGNAKKKEVGPDGSKDDNVFDIQQGVAITFFVKKAKKKKAGELATVYHADLYGKREDKYERLKNQTLASIPFVRLEYSAPNYFFVKKDFGLEKEYMEFVSLNELFPVNSAGIVTARDAFTIKHSKQEVQKTIEKFLSLDDESARKEFDLGKDVRDRTVAFAKQDLVKSGPDFENIVPISYRLFDSRYTYYTGRSKGFHCMPRGEVMKNFIKGKNLGIVSVNKQPGNNPVSYYFASKNIISNGYIRSDSVSIDTLFPLYVYNDDGTERKPNLNNKIIEEIEKKINMKIDISKKTLNHDERKKYLSQKNRSMELRICCDSSLKNLPNMIKACEENKKIQILLCKFPIDGRIHEKNPDGSPLTWTKKGSVYYSAGGSSDLICLEPIILGTCLDDISLASGFIGYKDKESNSIHYEGDFQKKYSDNINKNFNLLLSEFITFFGRERIEKDYVDKKGKTKNNFNDFLIFLNTFFQQQFRSEVFTQEGKIIDCIDYNSNSIITAFSLVTDDCDDDGIFSSEFRKKIKERYNFSVVSSYDIIPQIDSRDLLKTFSSEDLFDYIYAVLHHPVYRETYREFLKIDFPRVPFTTDKAMFWELVEFGHELRLWHLMEHHESSKLITQYPIGGDNVVGKVKFILTPTLSSREGESSVGSGDVGRVWINETQYVDAVPTVAREFYIGGYQPAQKWLKDRKEMVLGYEDIIHYQKIVLALSRTAEVMEKLREVKVV